MTLAATLLEGYNGYHREASVDIDDPIVYLQEAAIEAINALTEASQQYYIADIIGQTQVLMESTDSQGVMESAGDKLKELWNSFKEKVSKIISAIIQKIKAVIEWIKGLLSKKKKDAEDVDELIKEVESFDLPTIYTSSTAKNDTTSQHGSQRSSGTGTSLQPYTRGNGVPTSPIKQEQPEGVENGVVSLPGGNEVKLLVQHKDKIPVPNDVFDKVNDAYDYFLDLIVAIGDPEDIKDDIDYLNKVVDGLRDYMAIEPSYLTASDAASEHRRQKYLEQDITSPDYRIANNKNLKETSISDAMHTLENKINDIGKGTGTRGLSKSQFIELLKSAQVRTKRVESTTSKSIDYLSNVSSELQKVRKKLDSIKLIDRTDEGHTPRTNFNPSTMTASVSKAISAIAQNTNVTIHLLQKKEQIVNINKQICFSVWRNYKKQILSGSMG